MRILVIGSGGREHAIGWKLQQSPDCGELFFVPGNAGTVAIGKNLSFDPMDQQALREQCSANGIELIFVGPEAPLVDGIVNRVKADPEMENVRIVGPDKRGALLEGSKAFSKEFMAAAGIPTAAYREFTANKLEAGMEYLGSIPGPYVLKADGLAAGKGVLIIEELEEARKSLREMIEQSMFGTASEKVVVEEFLDGVEFSVFVLTDGKDYRILPVAKDYKRVGEGDTGLNTGGMGAISPVPFVDDALMRKVEERVVRPAINRIHSEGIDYTGILYCGLIKVGDEPFVIEFNCRFGDPETQVVLPRLESDLVELLLAAADGKLSEVEIQHDARAAATVVCCSGGYPGAYQKGKQIVGLDEVEGSTVFHAGTRSGAGGVETSGGRVLAVTSLAADLPAALKASYASIDRLCFDGIFYRKDIGYEFI